MEFTILAKHPNGETRRFKYNNQTNHLADEFGNVFRDTNYDATKQPNHLAPMYSLAEPIGKTKEVRRLKIQLGLSCNYSCEYCSQRFVERPPQTSKKDIEGFMRKLENLDFDEKRGLRVEFWGGEPFVYWKTIKPLTEAIQRRFSDWETPPLFSVITNGSILTPEICDWLYDNKFLVGMSHDGPGQSQRGPDPFDDPKQRQIILDFFNRMSAEGRMSFNSMLTKTNNSRRAIYEWFVELTGKPDLSIGEGALVDAYDEGGLANQLATKADHFAFRKQAFRDIYAYRGEIGFHGILEKVDGFTRSVLCQVPVESVGQKCGMDRPDNIAVDLHGDVLTCQNVSSLESAPNGEAHKLGNLDDLDAVKLKTVTRWSDRPHCAGCPVLHVCQGSCMFIQGDNWTSTCANAYSDSVALFALSIEMITNGFIPTFIEGGDLPPERRDIWGDMMTHTEEPPRKKSIPIKLVTSKTKINGMEVFTKTEVKAAQ